MFNELVVYSLRETICIQCKYRFVVSFSLPISTLFSASLHLKREHFPGSLQAVHCTRHFCVSMFGWRPESWKYFSSLYSLYLVSPFAMPLCSPLGCCMLCTSSSWKLPLFIPGCLYPLSTPSCPGPFVKVRPKESPPPSPWRPGCDDSWRGFQVRLSVWPFSCFLKDPAGFWVVWA